MPDHADSLNKAKTRWKQAGKAITALAMVPQGLLAGLMADYILHKKWNIDNSYVRLTNFLIWSTTAFEGKRRLITYFNTSNFESIPDFKESCKDFAKDSLPVKIARTLNYIWSIVPSLGFAYLTKYALVESAAFLRSYNKYSLDIFADCVEYPAVIWVLGMASFISNMLSFPGLHQRGFLFAKEMINSIFLTSNKTYILEIKAESQFNRGINPLVNEFNQFFKIHHKALLASSSQSADEKPLLAKLTLNDFKNNMQNQLKTGLARESHNLSDSLAQLLNLTDIDLLHYFSHLSQTQVSQSEIFKFKTFYMIGLLMTGLVWLGLLNFFAIEKNMVADLLGTKANAGVKSVLGYVLGVLMMASMACMALHGGMDARNFCHSRFATFRRIHPQLMADDRFLCVVPIPASIVTPKIIFNAIIICALGGAPNAYQALKIADQSSFFVIDALFASFTLELGGSVKLPLDAHQAKVLDKITHIDSDIAQLYRFLKRLADINIKQVLNTIAHQPIEESKAAEKSACSWFNCWKGRKTNEPNPSLKMLLENSNS